MAAVSGVPKRLGHVALRVRDVERSVRFYSGVVGLNVRMEVHGLAFLGITEDSSHELALFPLPAGAPGPEPARVGMYHLAWEMPSFEALEQLHRRLLANGVQIGGYSEGQSNVMFLDPDGNENEAFWEPAPAVLAEMRAAGTPMPQLPH